MLKHLINAYHIQNSKFKQQIIKKIQVARQLLKLSAICRLKSFPKFPLFRLLNWPHFVILNRIQHYFSNMKTSEAFIQEHLKLLDSADEWTITSRNERTIVINNYSFDQFIPFRLATQLYRKQCRAYENRKQYALPHTPKIIFVEDQQKKDQQLLMLVQRGQFPFQKLLAHYQDTQKGQLQLVLQIVSVAQMLQKKYGYFKFTQAMIRASKLPTLLVWISQNQVSNQPQFPIEPFYPINLEKNNKNAQNFMTPMKQMILSLFQVFSKKMKNSIISTIFSQKNETIDFEFVKKFILGAIKQQVLSQCTIGTPQSDKNRRYTEQKRRKMPQFLINRANTPKETHKYITQHNEQVNKKSALTYLQCQRKIEEAKDLGIKKVAVNKVTRIIPDIKTEKDHHLLYSVHFNSHGTVKSKQENIFEGIYEDNKNVKSQGVRVTESTKCTAPINFHMQANKEEKIIFRDSGKTVSTSSNNYYSLSSGSGKKFNSTFTQGQDQSKMSKVCRVSEKKYLESPQNIKFSQKQQKQFFKQLNKKQMKVSRIVEEHMQLSQAVSLLKQGHSPRTPSILNIFGPPTGTQLNLHSPGSQFYKDVDNILHSGCLSPKVSSQIDVTIEGEMQRILFD